MEHWEGLIEVAIMAYISCLDLEDASDKVMQIYHFVSVKLMLNFYQTDKGKKMLRDDDKTNSIVEFCTNSFRSINIKVLDSAAKLLFNQVQNYNDKSKINHLLQDAFKQIVEALGKPVTKDQNEA